MSVTLGETPAAAPDVAGRDDVLHRVALTVNSSLDIKEVLERLARLALEAIPADRCNLFLIDGSRYLVPALSIGTVTDSGLWHRFRALEPIDIRGVPERWELFRSGRALGIPDMAESPVVPPGIAETFRARSGLLTPMLAAGEPVGLLSLDWMAPGRHFDRQECALFEAIASYASMAVRNARLYQGLLAKNRTLERLVGLADALAALPSLASVLRLVSGAYEELLETTHCSINLIGDPDPERFQTIEIRGESWFAHAPSIAAVSPGEVARVVDLWRSAPRPVVYPSLTDAEVIDSDAVPDSVRAVALFPLIQRGKAIGGIVTGFDRVAPLDDAAVATGQALADLAAAAISRASVDESLRSRLQELEALYRLSDVAAGTAGLPAAVKRLNQIFGPDAPVTFESVAVSSRKVRDLVGGKAPTADESAAIKSWRACASGGRPLRPRSSGHGLLVPVARHGRVLGALRVRLANRPIGPDEESLLVAVGAACAEVIQKVDLTRELAERERRLVIATERDRIARDLHDSVGQTITGIGLRLSEYLADAPDRVWRERIESLIKLAGQGSRDVRQSIHALVFLDVRRHGLEASLRELARKFEATTGIATSLRAEGAPVPMPIDKEDALFRVAHEALMNVERHARAESASVLLRYDEGCASIVVRDDGVGIGQRDPFGQSGRFGIRGMQMRLDQAGGSLLITAAQPRGVVVEGRIPTSPGTGGSEGDGARARRSRR